MVQEISINDRLNLARNVGNALNEHGVPTLAAFWDYRPDEDSWQLRVVLRELPSNGIDFLMQLITLRDFGKLPGELEVADVRPTSADDARAKAIIGYAKALGKATAHVKATLLDRSFFEEAILGYVAPDYPAARTAA